MAAPMAEPPHLATDLKTLCLSTIAAEWQPLAEQATRQRQTPADYLAQLAPLEVTGRRERRIQRRLQDARFPMLKTLDAFSFEAQPDLDRDAILQVFDCGFVAQAANVVLVGGVGTGKTHLSIALGMACCQHDGRGNRSQPKSLEHGKDIPPRWTRGCGSYKRRGRPQAPPSTSAGLFPPGHLQLKPQTSTDVLFCPVMIAKTDLG